MAVPRPTDADAAQAYEDTASEAIALRWLHGDRSDWWKPPHEARTCAVCVEARRQWEAEALAQRALRWQVTGAIRRSRQRRLWWTRKRR